MYLPNNLLLCEFVQTLPGNKTLFQKQCSLPSYIPVARYLQCYHPISIYRLDWYLYVWPVFTMSRWWEEEGCGLGEFACSWAIGRHWWCGDPRSRLYELSRWKMFLVRNMVHSSLGPSSCQPELHQKWGFLNEHNCHQPNQMRSDARVNTGHLACPSGHWPGLDKKEREEWVVMENAGSLAALAVTGQGASKKQNSQLSSVPRWLSQKSVQTLQEKSVQTEKIPYFFLTRVSN